MSSPLKTAAIAMGKNPSREGLAKHLVMTILCPVLGRPLRAGNTCTAAIYAVYQFMDKHILRL